MPIEVRGNGTLAEIIGHIARNFTLRCKACDYKQQVLIDTSPQRNGETRVSVGCENCEHEGGESAMPSKGSRYTPKEDRQAKHIAASERKEGMSAKEATAVGYKTVNKQKSKGKK